MWSEMSLVRYLGDSFVRCLFCDFRYRYGSPRWDDGFQHENFSVREPVYPTYHDEDAGRLTCMKNRESHFVC